MVKDIKEKNESIDINDEKIVRLKELFPECFTKNGEFDISNFENSLSSKIKLTKEGYGLNFLGKNYAKVISSLDTETVLIPDKVNNSDEKNKDSENIYITGDNIDALKHLEKSYCNSIKCIYIDPLYNTGTDGFSYKDKFNFSVEKIMTALDISEEEAKRVYDMTNSESNSHSAWLTFMYPRLYIARKLLKKDGVMFISIDDNEISNLLKLCEMIFTEENVELMIWDKITGNENAGSGKMKITYRFRRDHEYIVVCYKDKEQCFFNKPLRFKKTKNEYDNPDNDPRGNWISSEICKSAEKSNPKGKNYYTLTTPGGIEITRQWHYSEEELNELIADNRIYFGNGKIIPRLKKFLSEPDKITPSSLITGIASQTDGNNDLQRYDLDFDNPKPVELIKWLIEIGSNENDYVLDFFSGSATTAEAVMELSSNGMKRKFILVQLPELYKKTDEAYKKGFKSIDEVGRKRIKLSSERIKKESSSDFDSGYKHYYIRDIDTKTIDKLEKFEPDWIDNDKTIVEEFGIDSILTTWINGDGYGLTDKYETIDFEGYLAYKCKNTLYLINPSIPDKSIKYLIEKYNDSLNCDRIVLFGYSFSLNEIQTLKDNLKQVKNTKDITVNLITRY